MLINSQFVEIPNRFFVQFIYFSFYEHRFHRFLHFLGPIQFFSQLIETFTGSFSFFILSIFTSIDITNGPHLIPEETNKTLKVPPTDPNRFPREPYRQIHNIFPNRNKQSIQFSPNGPSQDPYWTLKGYLANPFSKRAKKWSKSSKKCSKIVCLRRAEPTFLDLRPPKEGVALSILTKMGGDGTILTL